MANAEWRREFVAEVRRVSMIPEGWRLRRHGGELSRYDESAVELLRSRRLGDGADGEEQGITRARLLERSRREGLGGWR
jgi:hypothetical protein